MPELPEVETIKLGLQKYLIGHTIENVKINFSKIISGNITDIIGAKVTEVKRFGKGLVIELSNGYALAIHIKLTGQLIYQGDDEPEGTEVSILKVGTVPNKFTHVIFDLDHNAKLYYNDIRRFGWIKILPNEMVKELPFFRELGPEPFDGLTLEKFTSIISKSKTPVKPLLIDQKKIGGIGNIYSNDALFLAKILPTRPASSLSPEETEQLYESILTVLKRGLQYGGASELTFVNALGMEGSYQKHFLVYGQQGKPCMVCGGIIKKITLGGRGTYYCEKCQS